MSTHETYVITFLDGSTEECRGELRIHENVLFIEVRGSYGGYLHEQHAFPLTSVRKWEWKER